MENPNLDRCEPAPWTCSVCGRSRLCPYTVPRLDGTMQSESCRSCGDALAVAPRPGTSALRTAIQNYLV